MNRAKDGDGASRRTRGEQPMRAGWVAPVIALLLLSLPAHAQFVVAPDVVVYCEPTLRPVVAEIAKAWRRESDVPVRLFASPTAAILEQVGHRARADLIIGEGEAAGAAAAERHIIKPETRAPLWRNRLVVAARGKATPLAAAADLATQLDVAPVAIVDPPVGSAGANSRAALAALGLWPKLEPHAVGVVDTADAAFLLTHGTVTFAVVYASDVATSPGFNIAAPLPDAAYPPVLYWMAETQNQLSPETAAFATFLRAAPAQQAARAAGLEVMR
jgi:molybdate transport system substrate-binding protein